MCVFNTGSGCLSSACADGRAVKAASLSHTSDMIHVHFQKEELMMTPTTDECASVRERTLLLEQLCVCVSVP